MHAKYYPEILKAIGHFGEDVNIGVILKYYLRVRLWMWAGFIRLWIGFSGRLL
jgi:hypothetical protein